MMNMKQGFAALTLALLLGGCSTMLVSKEPQQTIYSLRPALEEQSDIPQTKLARVIEIPRPSVPPGMERNRIALYMNDGQKLDYFASALWAAPLEDVLQNFTRRTATSVLPYVVAVTPDQNLDANYRLQIKVNEFQPVYGGNIDVAPLLKANIEFTLISMPADKIVSSFTLSQQRQLENNRLDLIVAGLESMLQDIEREAFIKMNDRIGAR